jgi:hypothetical protein
MSIIVIIERLSGSESGFHSTVILSLRMPMRRALQSAGVAVDVCKMFVKLVAIL